LADHFERVRNKHKGDDREPVEDAPMMQNENTRGLKGASRG
jgi:hypothetical protein